MYSYLKKGFASLEILGVLALVLAVGVAVTAFNNVKNPNVNAGEQTQLAVFSLVNDSDIANEDGNNYNFPSSPWLGTGENTGSSYLGIVFKGSGIPKGATINSAKVTFTQPKTAWNSMSFKAYAEKSSSPQSFSKSNGPSKRSLTSTNSSYTDNVKWEAGKQYSYDVSAPVQELVNSFDTNSISLIFKGTGSQWGRKFIYNGGEKPKLEVQYTTSSSGTPTVTATTIPTATPTSQPTKTPSPSPTPTRTPTPRPTTPRPTSTPTPTPVVTTTTIPTQTSGGNIPDHMQRSALTGELIYGVAPEGSLGTCTAADHDKYVTRGPDGRLYRTWHPTVDPSSGCRYGHEHGDNPATSAIYKGPVPFSYIGSNVGIDMPHVGYKCFVQNKGLVNDEGSTALHDVYYCFHMGTAGTGRYTAQFHELYFFMRSGAGYVMNIQGLADTGGVAGTICDSPRHGRTVQGFGCRLDSSYEIWANDLAIRNGGNTVAFAEVSTAVFDPITTMDPSDLTRVVYTWDPEVQEKVYKFKNSRDHYRGCEREAYSGPVKWGNGGGSTVYYTDAYGNVVNGGPLRQEISSINNSANGEFYAGAGKLIMTYKGGGDRILYQYRFRNSWCSPGLGLSN